jgi:SOS regulatory protein LexA
MRNKSSTSLDSVKPSKRQAEILQFIKVFRDKNGYSPSLSEIGKNFAISIPTVHQHVSYLRKKNLLTTEKGKRRSIQTFNSGKNGMIEIPLIGIIAAGGPVEAIMNPRPIEVPKNMLSPGARFYALKVAGVSMIEDGIFDGDVVIVRDQQTVDDGEKAVAYLPDKDAVTLKRIYRDRGRVKLVPANKSMKPFYEKNVEIQGKVVGVLRREH